MGLFSKSKPRPVRSNGPFWLAPMGLEGHPDVHVYQALRLFTRAEAEQYGIVPWDLAVAGLKPKRIGKFLERNAQSRRERKSEVPVQALRQGNVG